MTEKPQKTQKQYECKSCLLITSNKADFFRHLTTRKHKTMTHCNECKRIYSSRQSLWSHKKKCKNTTLQNSVVTDIQPNTVQSSEEIEIPSVTVDKDAFLQLIRNNRDLILDNREFKKMLLEQNEKMIELAQTNRVVPTNNTNTINNTTNNNTNNTQFNLNVFLNEKCKDALNWTDFIKGIVITKEDLLRTGAMGFVNGMSHIIIENLKKLSEDKRPLHNTDCKRRTIYVRDDGTWEVQENYSKFEKAADMISDKTKIVWISTNDDGLSIEEDNALMKACVNMATTTAHLEKIPKIFNNVVKEVIVNKRCLE
jgi:hypothetical protein